MGKGIACICKDEILETKLVKESNLTADMVRVTTDAWEVSFWTAEKNKGHCAPQLSINSPLKE